MTDEGMAPDNALAPQGGAHRCAAWYHIDLTVRDPTASFGFYDAVLGFLGYRCVNKAARGFDWDIGDHGRDFCSIGVKKSTSTGLRRLGLRIDTLIHLLG